jgi:PAS domain S-box-containing protein
MDRMIRVQGRVSAMNDTFAQVEPVAGGSAPPEGDAASRRTSRLLRAVDWFIRPSIDDATLRQRMQVYVVAHLTGPLCGLAVVAGFYAVTPPSAEDLAWLGLAIAALILFPFGLRSSGRLDVMGTLSSQYFTAIVLFIAYDYGGLVSPAIPWLVLCLATAIYYLAPWPRWRNLNLAVEILQVVAFVALHLSGVEAPTVPAETLLTVWLVSGCALVAFITVVSLQIWAMDIAKQRQLEREMAVRHSIEADQNRIAEELRRGRDHLARSQRVAMIGSAEIVYSPVYETQWSDALFSLFGLDPASSKAPTADEFLRLVHPEDRSVVQAYRDRESRGDYPRASEFRITRPDGGQRWVRRQAEPIEWRDGRPCRVIATYLDVTEQKEAQLAVINLEEQLSQAHKMEAIGQLTGGVAHDFNNLLGVLLGRLEMIDEELADARLGDTATLRGWVRSCIRAVDRGATLTKSMLAFSRQQALAPVALDVNTVVTDMEEMLRRALGESYRLDVVKAPDLWRTEADAGQLQNALLNLVLNGRDATPDGGTLTIETRNRHLGADYVVNHVDVEIGDYVELTVRDHGTGMTPETLRRAFEPFFTTKEVGKGSGLGLSMVYGFVRQSGGHVAIESEVGRGTTVRICLPRKEGKPVVAGNAGSAETSAAPRRELILIVEDNEELRDVTHRQVERMGYAVLEAGHGTEALNLLERHPETKLMLSDIVLPFGMNGVELAANALDRFPDLRVLFMSGYNEEHDALKRIEGRFPVRLLQKPFQPAELAAQIRAALAAAPRRPG